MNSRLGFLALTAGLLLLLLLIGSMTRRDPLRRAPEIFTEMVYSVAHESLTASSDFPGGTTQQPTVPGAVLRGAAWFPYGATPEEAERAGDELISPLAADDSESLQPGQRLYSRYCTLCHDAGGGGRGSVVQRGMLPPPSLHAIRAKEMKDGQLFHLLTKGQGNMASYAAQLTPTERWQVILYLRHLQEQGGSQ
jgi:mono/diheme cytochrome c family protein